jgi:hypothetical protein
VGRNLLRPVRRSFQMTYAMCGALCWSVASWLEGRRISDLSSWTAKAGRLLFCGRVCGRDHLTAADRRSVANRHLGAGGDSAVLGSQAAFCGRRSDMHTYGCQYERASSRGRKWGCSSGRGGRGPRERSMVRSCYNSHADEHPDAAYVECPHGFVHVTGPVDSSMQPVCTLTECVCDALDWCWDTLKPTPHSYYAKPSLYGPSLHDKKVTFWLPISAPFAFLVILSATFMSANVLDRLYRPPSRHVAG